MAACPKLFDCGFHRSISMKEALGVWQSFYCEGCFARCERFKLVSAGVPVPENLLPNGRLVGVTEDELAVAGASARRRR
jgi:hypothetical protein